MIMWYLSDHFFSHIIIQNSERMIILLSDEEIKICPVVDKDALWGALVGIQLMWMESEFSFPTNVKIHIKFL